MCVPSCAADYISRLKFHLLTYALSWLNALLNVGRVLLTSLRAGWARLQAAEAAWERRVLGEDYAILHFFTQSALGLRIASAAGTARRVASHLAKLANFYRRAVKWLQRQVKAFLRDTQHDLYPWALAMAGYRVQTGELSLRGVPGYFGRLSAYPVVATSKLAAASWRMGVRLLKYVLGRPVVATIELATRVASGLRPVTATLDAID